MDKKERALLRKIFQISSMVASNVNEKNVDNIHTLFEKLENDLKTMIKEPLAEALPIWRNFPNMTEDEIRQEFSNVEKYPDVNAIKSAVKGFLEMRKVSKVKTRETLIEHIIAAYRKRQYAGKYGR
jgi:hypothetical protein